MQASGWRQAVGRSPSLPPGRSEELAGTAQGKLREASAVSYGDRKGRFFVAFRM